MSEEYSRRDVLVMGLKLAVAPFLTYVVGCGKGNRGDTAALQVTGRPIRQVLDDLVANYDGSNVISVIGVTAPSSDVVGLADITTAFQAATSQPAPTAYLDVDIIPEDPVYTRNIFTIGTEPNNLVIESFVREYQPNGLFLPPSGTGVLQSFSLLSGQEAIAIMGVDYTDRRKSARVIAEALLDPTMYDLNGNVVHVLGDISNKYTQVII